MVQHVPLQGNLPPAILVHAPDTAKLTNGQNGLNVTAVAVQAPNPAAVLLRSMPSMVGTNALHLLQPENAIPIVAQLAASLAPGVAFQNALLRVVPATRSALVPLNAAIAVVARPAGKAVKQRGATCILARLIAK